MFRVELRCPSPSPFLQRSGATILDVHSLTLTSQSPLGDEEMYPRQFDRRAESTYRESSSQDNYLLTAEWRALLLSCSSAGTETARGFCSIGPLSSPGDREGPASQDHIRFQDEESPLRRFTSLKLSRSSPSLPERYSRRSAAIIAEIDIPSILLNLPKPLFDGLQFWIDDVSQLLERTTASPSEAAQENASRNPSLVGSRFFSGSKQGSMEIDVDGASPDHVKPFTESIIKVTVSEGEILLILITFFSTDRSLHETLNFSGGRTSLR